MIRSVKPAEAKRKLLEQVRLSMRARRYRVRTEET